MTRLTSIAAVAASLLSVAPPAQAQSWTAERVAERAVERGASIDAADAAIAAADANTRAVWAQLLPRVSVSARYTRLKNITNDPLVTGLGGGSEVDALIAGVDDPEARLLWAGATEQQRSIGDSAVPFFPNQYAIEATVQVPLSEIFTTLLPALRASRGAVEAREAERAVAEAALRLRAHEAFSQFVRARAMVAMTEASLDDAREQLANAEAALEAGAARRSEVLGAQAQLEAAEAARIEAVAGRDATAEGLRALLGLPVGEPLPIVEPPDQPPADHRMSLARALAVARSQRAEAVAIRRWRSVHERRARAAEGSRYPALRLGAGAQLANPNPRYVPQRDRFDGTWDVSVILAWSPNDAIAGGADADAARAAAARMDAELQRFEDGLRAEVAGQFSRDAAAAARVAHARALIAAAEEARRLREREREVGRATTTDVLDAQAVLARARLALVDASAEAHLARARLRHATGTLR